MLSARPQLRTAGSAHIDAVQRAAFPTSGAGNDENGLPVPMCRAPDGTDQLQCYCSVGLCGAGMVDADAAVLAATGTLARIGLAPAAPVVGDTLRLSAAGSLVASGRSIVSYEWALTANPGVVTGFAGATNGPEVELPTVAAGTVTVSLVLLDDAGQRSTVQRDISVAAAPVPDAPAASGGGGGVVGAVGRSAGSGGRCIAARPSAQRRSPRQDSAAIIAPRCEHHDKNAPALGRRTPRGYRTGGGDACLAAAGPDRAVRWPGGTWPDRASEATGGQRQPAPARRQPAHARGHAGVGALAACAG